MHARAGVAALRHASRRGLATTSVDSLTVPGEFDRLNNLLPYKPTGRNGSNGIVATIFGSTGLIGKFVLAELAINGTQCIVPFRGDGLNTRSLKMAGDLGQVIPVPFDIFDSSSIQRAVEQSNVVINLVGNNFDTRAFSLHDSNVKTAYRIAKFAKEAGVKRFVQMSSTQAAPNAKSQWARHKYEAETIVRDFLPEATILRVSDVYGDGDKFIHKFARMAHFLGRNLTTNEMLTKKVAPVWAGDVGRAIALSLVDADAPGNTYELTGPGVFTWKKFLEDVAERTWTDNDHRTVPLPQQLMQGVAAVLEKSPAEYKILSQDMLARWEDDNIAHAGSKGFKDLGHTPVAFEEQGYKLLVHYDQTQSKVGWSYFDPDSRRISKSAFTTDGDYKKDPFPRRFAIKYNYGPTKEVSRL